MIRFVTPEDFPAIAHIWHRCFGDEEAYIRFFWEHGAPLGRGLVAEVQEQPVSMLFLLPGALAHETTLLPSAYVYAVATLPEHRGQGLAGALTRRAADIAREEGKAALCLLPANAGLYDYYAALGFQRAFCRHDTAAQSDAAVAADWDACIAMEHRHRCWNSCGYFQWDASLLDYMRQEQCFTGGQVLWDGKGFVFAAGERLMERCVCAPTEEPRGMLLPLNAQGEAWLQATNGQAYLGLCLE